MKKETVTLNTQEQQRVLILNRIQSGQLSVGQAAPLIGVSERHVRRILAAYREKGVAAIAHGNRGRQPSRTIAQDVRSQVLSLARTTYSGCTVSHLRDLLAEREQIVLSRSSVRRILLSGGLLDGQSRKAPRHRRRRTHVQTACLTRCASVSDRLLHVVGSHASVPVYHVKERSRSRLPVGLSVRNCRKKYDGPESC